MPACKKTIIIVPVLVVFLFCVGESYTPQCAFEVLRWFIDSRTIIYFRLIKTRCANSKKDAKKIAGIVDRATSFSNNIATKR